MSKRSFGESIKHYRKLAGMSQEELANRTGLSISSIQGYEHGKFVSKFSNLQKIAAALDIPVGLLARDYIPPALVQSIIDYYYEDSGFSIYQTFLLDEFEKLNEDGQLEAVRRIRELSYVPEYKRPRK